MWRVNWHYIGKKVYQFNKEGGDPHGHQYTRRLVPSFTKHNHIYNQ